MEDGTFALNDAFVFYFTLGIGVCDSALFNDAIVSTVYYLLFKDKTYEDSQMTLKIPRSLLSPVLKEPKTWLQLNLFKSQLKPYSVWV